ncbi:hypothetical protein [Ferrimonas futtsuensis]|uniref:hypothetical protein n=1 Tax=Ferrimonas futtsuensis TaxID=364764 RepID=UPI0004296161|nr:hypothetical protein [Ferrimonas futtsuensis]
MNLFEVNVMSLNPPIGSDIRLTTHNGHQLVVMPQESRGATRLFVPLFLSVWMVGWAFGWVSAAREVLAGEGGLFLIVWLTGWTLGGAFAGYALLRSFKKPTPEQWLLAKPSLHIDTGLPPMRHVGRRGGRASWKEMFPQRQRFELTPTEMATLALRETDSGNRLTVDLGAQRIELAQTATEIEREWLYELLSLNYRI